MDDGCQMIKTIKLVCYCLVLYFFCLCHIYIYIFIYFFGVCGFSWKVFIIFLFFFEKN
jgi:hypothetical protein